MYGLIADYGIVALGFLLSGLTTLIVKHGLTLIDSKTVREYTARGWNAARTAVLFVGQTYVDEIKLGRSDGKLTAEEKLLVKEKAIAAAKSYIGAKGIKELAKIFDVEEWIGTKIEAVIGEEKRLGKPAAKGALSKPRAKK